MRLYLFVTWPNQESAPTWEHQIMALKLSTKNVSMILTIFPRALS